MIDYEINVKQIKIVRELFATTINSNIRIVIQFKFKSKNVLIKITTFYKMQNFKTLNLIIIQMKRFTFVKCVFMTNYFNKI